jgi:hypothetical protein
MNSTLSVAATVYIDSTISVAQSAFVGTVLDVSGATAMNSTLSVAGEVYIDSTLSVAQSAFVGTFLDVSGATTMNSTLSVAGAVHLGSTLNVNGSTVMSELSVTGDTSLSALTVEGVTDLKDDLQVVSIWGVGVTHYTDVSNVKWLKFNGSIDVSGDITKNGEEITGGTVPVSDTYADFDMLYGIDVVTEVIAGSFTFGISHDWAQFGWGWIAYSSANALIIPSLDGYIDTTAMTYITSGTNPARVHINLMSDDGILLGKDSEVYIVSNTSSINIDPMYVQVYNPSTVAFQRKAESDFTHFYGQNTTWGATVVQILHPNVTMLSDRLHTTGTTDYIITFIAGYFVQKLFGVTTEAVNGEYALHSSASTNYWVYTSTDDSWADISDSNGSYLYPFVTYMRWKNAISPTFKPTSRRAELGFGSLTEAFATLTLLVSDETETDDDYKTWAYALYKATYMFVKHNFPTALYEEEETEETLVKAKFVSNVLGAADASSIIRFVTSDINPLENVSIAYLHAAFDGLEAFAT